MATSTSAADASVSMFRDGGRVNVAYNGSNSDEVRLSFEGSHLMLQQRDLPLLAGPHLLSPSSLSSLGAIATTAELFGRGALPTSIGPKDPSEFLIPLSHHSQLDIVEAVTSQPGPGSFTRSFLINGEDMSALFSLNLTVIYKGSSKSRILANLKDRSGDCVAVFRGPEGSQGCVCCCTRCAQSRMKAANIRSTQLRGSISSNEGSVFLNPQESLTIQSPPGVVIGHIALHHDFYGVYNRGMLQLLYSVPFRPNHGSSHTITCVETGSAASMSSAGREQGRISRCGGPNSALKVNIRPPHLAHSSHHKLLLIATAICMFGMEAERTARPLEWLGCTRLRNILEDGCC